MISDYSVVIKYKNKKLEDVAEATYSLQSYTDMLSAELKGCLNDLEDSFHNFLGNDEDLRMNASFMKLRKHILDTANSIERLPDTMYYKGASIKTMKASDYISDIINRMENK